MAKGFLGSESRGIIRLATVHFRPIWPETGPEYTFGRPIECLPESRIGAFADGRRYLVRSLFIPIDDGVGGGQPLFETRHEVEVFTPAEIDAEVSGR